MVLIPHLHPDKKQSHAFWKLITSDGQLSAALKEHASFFCRDFNEKTDAIFVSKYVATANVATSCLATGRE